MAYDEEEYLNLSGIQHFEFCRRRWALIHIEQQWEENYLTVAGELMHENAHDKDFVEKRKNIIITRGMPVYSRKMGISGECDIVEFIKDDKHGISLFGREGKYSVEPVEYKHGTFDESNLFQLTAEAMCLEEMLYCEIPYGYIYYGKARRREKVEITSELREKVIKDFEEMHRLYERKYTPKVRTSKACQSCSLKNLCLPNLMKKTSARKYIDDMISED